MQVPFLIDCGEGTQIQLKKYKIKAQRINHIFISHLHGDHYYGLMGLISSLHLFGRKKELNIYGPPGLREIISLQLKYSQTSLKYKINLYEWTPGKQELLLDTTHLTVHSFPLDHRIDCSGFIFREKPKKRRIDKTVLPENLSPIQIILLKNGEDITDKEGNVLLNKDYTLDPAESHTYAYCSDTKYDPDLIPIIKDADLLYHETTFMDDMKERAKLTFHTTTLQAGDLAKKANIGQLVIGHFSTRYKDLNPMLAETRTVFENAELAIEGREFIVD